MQLGSIFPVPNGRVRLVSKNDLRDSPAWRAAFETKCKDYRYYEILEETLADGFEHHYLVIEDGDNRIRAVQPLFFLRQNLTEGVAGKVREVIDSIRRKFPRFL